MVPQDQGLKSLQGSRDGLGLGARECVQGPATHHALDNFPKGGRRIEYRQPVDDAPSRGGPQDVACFARGQARIDREHECCDAAHERGGSGRAGGQTHCARQRRTPTMARPAGGYHADARDHRARLAGEHRMIDHVRRTGGRRQLAVGIELRRCPLALEVARVGQTGVGGGRAVVSVESRDIAVSRGREQIDAVVRVPYSTTAPSGPTPPTTSRGTSGFGFNSRKRPWVAAK